MPATTRTRSSSAATARSPPCGRPTCAGSSLNLAGLRDVIDTAVSVVRHAAGRVTAEEAAFIPEPERHRVYREARAWLAVYAAVIGLAIVTGSLLPLMYVGLPSLYGRWLATSSALSQHAGLAENVLDHRLNARTIRMNPVFRFLYWNMNFHVEHHMFPMVPYHALPALHAEIAADLPDAVSEPVRGLPRDPAHAAPPDARTRVPRGPCPARAARALPPRDARRSVRRTRSDPEPAGPPARSQAPA